MPAHIDRQSAAPLHDQLRRLIVELIARDDMQPGDPLPGEHRLCEQYGVSRTVVRQALAQLESEGVVERVKGKGTFVARPRVGGLLVHTLVGLFDEVERRGGHVRSEILQHERIAADADVAAALEIEVGAPVVVLRRRRFVDGEAWSLSTTWMPESVGAVTLGADLENSSLHRLLAAHGHSAVHGIRSAEATVAAADQARLLGVGAGTALLRLRSISRDATAHPMEFFIAYHRGDRSRFEFQLGPDSSQGALTRVP